tara:strand:- start:501 stop:932 length:432 start_codon:yes stop_codon:yes gene_type:complete
MNMKRISIARTTEVNTMLSLLMDLDEGKNGDYMGFQESRIVYRTEMKGRINSYRAQKIARFLGKNISKSHLVKFSKNKEEIKKLDMELDNLKKINPHFSMFGDRKITVDEFLEINEKSLWGYWNYVRGADVISALAKLDKNQN